MLSSGGYTFGIVRNSFSGAIKATNYFRKSAYTSGFLLFFLALFTLCPLYLVPESTEAATKNANPATLTFAFTNNKNTASVSVAVTDENATGYTLNLRTTGATTTLSDGTHSINTISSSGITADNFAVNTYGILPSKYNSSSNTTNYYPASTTGWTMEETSAANTTANTYTVGLGLKANYATVAGTYTTANTDNGNTGASLVLEYVANAVTYSVNYYTNTTDTVTGMPSINPQTGTVAQGTTSTSINLASAPSRTGYTFKGWCLGSNASTSNITVKTDGTSDICNSTTYDAGQSFGIDATKSPDTYYLFAMWQRNSYTCTKQYRLQNADGTFPSTYTSDTTEQVLYGDTCSYSKTVTNYKNAANGTNNATASTSGTMTENGLTLSLDFYRNTFTCKIDYKLQNADGTYGSVTNAVNTTKRYGEACSWSRNADTTYKAASYTNNSITANVDTTVSVDRNTFTVTKQYRLQDTSGNYPSSYTSDGTATVLYGASYTYSRSATTTHQAKSQTISSVTSAQTISLDVPRVLVTCNRQYRLENADGSWGSYTTDGSVNAYYGGSCSYSKSVTDYKGSSSGTNGSAGSASASNVTSTQTLSVSLYRNTYTLTVTAGSNTSGASGGGTKRWGQTSTVSVTKASNVTCTSYATPTWTQSGTTGTFSSTSGASVNFTMGKGDATVTATSTASNVAQTVTLSRSGGASGINIGGTNYTGSSASLNCGSYSISGNYSSGYEFSSWAVASNVSVASTSSASTTLTVSGAGTLTLNGKASCTAVSGTMQAFSPTSNTCTSGTLTDSRDNQTYTVKKINGAWWMTRNLAIGCNGSGSTYGSSMSSKSLTSSNSNVSATWSTPTLSLDKTDNTTRCTTNSTSGCSSYTDARMKCSSTYGAWYNYAAASAGTIATSSAEEGEDIYNICPKGWTLPGYGSSAGQVGSVTSYIDDFSPVAGGYYNYGDISSATNGYWWSTTLRHDGTLRYVLGFNGSSLSLGYNYRRIGSYVRCIKL